jgi:CBS-domain-containing membrane protein
MMLDWNDYRKQLALGAKKIGQLNPDTINGYVARYVWTALLLGAVALLDLREGRALLIPPFVATLTILLYLPDASIARPIVVVCGSVLGAAIGTLFSFIPGAGVGVAVAASLTAMIVLPALRICYPPGVALAMFSVLFHPGPWFAVEAVLPFALTAVISFAAISRLLRLAKGS